MELQVGTACRNSGNYAAKGKYHTDRLAGPFKNLCLNGAWIKAELDTKEKEVPSVPAATCK